MKTLKTIEDLTGQTFGRLVVLEQAEDHVQPSGQHKKAWKCQCSCEDHTIITVLSSNLKNGNTTSCGCYNKEKISQTNTNRNKYNLDGEYGICFLFDGSEVLFDKEDYDLINDWTWCNNKCYAYSRKQNGKTAMMHRLVMGLSDKDEEILVDHINHNTLDNRKCNLRFATKSQNTMNAVLRSDNTSGVSGVYWHKTNQKWISRIDKDGKSIYLGCFDNYQDAVLARQKAEQIYFKEYSYQNSIKTQQNDSKTEKENTNDGTAETNDNTNS